jgi:ferredoxin-NADP reductase
VRSFRTVERYGLVWTALDPVGEPDPIDVLEGVECTALRALPFEATPAHVLEALSDYTFAPSADLHPASPPDMARETVDGLGVVLVSTRGEHASTVVFFVQPLDADRAMVRPILVGAADAVDLGVLAHHAHALDDLRSEVEAEALRLERPAKLAPEFVPVAEPDDASPDPRRAPVRVTVAAKHETATGIMAFELAPLSGPLPSFQPGAHIDLHLPNGLVRQYSLVNGPDETDVYRIGVKLSEQSSGGSSCLHADVREGDILAISEPHNNFTLRRDAVRTILVAGGIGVTPLLAMAKTLERSGLDWVLHYFAQGTDHVAFTPELARLGDGVVLHLGHGPDATAAELTTILGAPGEYSHVYICGPGPMLDAARAIASASGWTDDTVHFEYFENATEIADTTAFEVSLARSALTLPVRAGETILEVLRANGVDMPSSCEQGACGTCLVKVIAGTPDHQDVYMNDAEHAANDRIATCVSRALSDRLILDI